MLTDTNNNSSKSKYNNSNAQKAKRNQLKMKINKESNQITNKKRIQISKMGFILLLMP